MASCPAPADGCRGCVNELAMLAWYVNTPFTENRDKIMPQPAWCQEAAMVGWLIDSIREAKDA